MRSWYPLPASVYALVERTPGSVLLESARSAADGTLSRIFLQPTQILVAYAAEDVPNLLAQVESAIESGFFAAGFLAYECARAFEPTALPAQPAQREEPLAWFGLYERCFLFNHGTGTFGDPPPSGIDVPTPFASSTPAPELDLTPALTSEDFAQRIEQIHSFIRAGDVYQLNFTFPLQGRFTGSAAELYASLVRRQPVDYAAFLHTQPGCHILSLSPELFFRIDPEGVDRRITTRPMKGTAPRGRTTWEDREISERLRTDPKNCAENVMIVDLLRNDIGRLCTYGSVTVRDLFAVERYPTLWQMTSTVTGILRPEVDPHDVLRALFPCGSITGAPKVRAMQLLAGLEEAPRGIYTGAIGFFSREQSIFNVAIRTLALQDGRATFAVGSGIVIDSDPGAEYQECLLKAEFLSRSTEPFSLIETMLWDGSAFPLLELHLDRLQGSASYFDFPCDRDTVRAELLAVLGSVLEHHPRRVRLLLDPNGSLHITHELLQPDATSTQPLSVCIAADRTHSSDRFLYHKTTHRPLYQAGFKAAQAAGFADVLFLNEHGHVTEGAISTVFIEQAGHWFTPPVASGLLSGVFRRHLLATRPGIEERILTPEDLRSADAVYLANAVRGLRRVSIDWSQPLVLPGCR